MHARLASIELGPGQREAATEIAKAAYSAFSTQKGFVSAIYFGDTGKGDYHGFYLFDSKADIEAAMDATSPELNELLKKYPVKGPAEQRLYEVIDIGN